MEKWSPETSVRYGFSRVNSSGNVVSIWNFPDFEDELKDIESGDQSESKGDIAGASLMSEMDTLSPVNTGPLREELSGPVLELSSGRECICDLYTGIGEVIHPNSEVKGDDETREKVFHPLERTASEREGLYDHLPLLEPDWTPDLDEVICRHSANIDSCRVALFVVVVFCMVSQKEGHPLTEAGRDLLIHILCHSFE